MGVLDKIKKRAEARQAAKNSNSKYGKNTNIWWKPEEGENEIRLVDEFLEVKQHYLGKPSGQPNGLGLASEDSFNGDNKVPKMVNCPDWNLDLEAAEEELTCPICRLNRIAKGFINKDGSSKEEKEYFQDVSDISYARSRIKWNIIDRVDPLVTQIENGQEKTVTGFKIADISMEAYRDIEGIFNQCNLDITDPDNGIDISIIKGHNGHRVQYTAKAVISGTGLKVTPMTDEEKEADLLDLKKFCGKQTDVDLILHALQSDYQEVLEISEDELKG